MSTVAAPSALIRIALLGNPNTGKSTLFNRLTGLRQHIANYPGITVEKKTGILEIGKQRLELIDLPGTYSLAASSPDERIVLDALRGKAGHPSPDLIVCVVDATNLKRNLFLASEVAELGLPMVIALNQWDAALRNGIKIDCEKLSERLGVPVIPTVAKRGEGLDKLRQAIERSLDDADPMAGVCAGSAAPFAGQPEKA
jgi:ferrous iron transport protein B